MREKYKDPVFMGKIRKHLKEICGNEKCQVNSQLKNRFKAGHYVKEDGSVIFYNSSWELLYIQFCERSGIKIGRCKERITYQFDGKDRIYLPDFVIEVFDKKIIVEIKGTYKGSAERVEPKKIAAISFVKESKEYDDYVLYKEEELRKIGLDLSKTNIKRVLYEADKGYEDYKKTV